MTGIVECTVCKSQYEHISVGFCPACNEWVNYGEMAAAGVDLGHTGHRYHGFCKKCDKYTLMEEWLVD